MPSDFQLKTMNTIHRTLLKLSFGKIGWSAMGMPVVELTTTGRKSGQPRTTMLTSPLQRDGQTIIVASRGGDDNHPAWYLNLVAEPNVTARIGGSAPRQLVARVAEGDERAQLWQELTSAHDMYAGYQKSTSREIPVVILESE